MSDILRKAVCRVAPAIVSLLLGAAAMAQGDAVPPEMVSPARLGIVEGSVQFWRPGADGWVAAPLNAALAAGDALQTGDRGTAEVQVGPRDFVRLTANTALTVVAHDAGLMQFRVTSGTASFDLRSVQASRLVEIDAPDVSIVVGGTGYYRLDVAEGMTRFTVRRQGRATLSLRDGRSRNVASAEQVTVWGTGQANMDVRVAPPPDSWDRWSDDRSDYYSAAASNRYVPADAYGAADLDRYGNWREVETYGWIWVPEVATGWAPYSTGSWHWDAVYGWTWVDQAPWGWTTSHYGRWVFLNGYWAWAPGPRGPRAIYAPALVTFSRFGNDGLSWVALGWGEPLVPWWGRPGFRGNPWWGGWGGPRLGIDIEGYRYRNWNAPNSVITVPGENLGHYRPRFGPQPSPPGGVVEARPRRGEYPMRPQSSVGTIPRDASPVPPAQPAPAQMPATMPAPVPVVPPAPHRVAPLPSPTQPMLVPAPAPAPAAIPAIISGPQRAVPPVVQPQPAPAAAPAPPSAIISAPQRAMPPAPQPPSAPAAAPAVRIEPVPRMPARPEFRSEPRVEPAPAQSVGRPPAAAPPQGGESRAPRERGAVRERRSESTIPR